MTRHPGGESPCPQQSDHSAPLLDNHGRRITYLRLSITDRCNLRCRYCRPEQGVPFIPHDEILSFEELERLVTIFCDLGVSKIRVTGGEPFSRRGCMPFLERLRKIRGVERLHITTNGVRTLQFLDDLAAISIDGINLSLDTLEPERFRTISRRDYLDAVLETLDGIIKRGIPLKINSVVLEDTTDAEIRRLAALPEKLPVSLRFIELMPFSGKRCSSALATGNLVRRLQNIFPDLTECATDQPTTARIFTLPGYTGSLGIIQGYSRLFCATCNKLRITPVGMLKTCLYDNGVLDLKKLLRGGADNQEIRKAVLACVRHRFANGHEAERASSRKAEPSMAKIGG
jgi:cyclic pyranopterin phosphate synthase